MDANHCMLTYSNQLEFKRWAARQGLSEKKSGVNYYFDFITPVDGRNQIAIPGFYADGHTSWQEAADILKKYFNISNN